MPEDFLYPADKFLLLGKIAKAHGLRGEVKVFLHSGQPENIQNYQELVLVDRTGKCSTPLTILKSRCQGKTAIVQFASITSRSLAEEIEGRGVLLAIENLPEINEDEYYWHEFLGKNVVDIQGEAIGKVVHIFPNGAQDILVVKSVNEEILIPVTKSIIVEETAEQLTINPPPGLIELNTGS